jgi:putative endonuclease
MEIKTKGNSMSQTSSLGQQGENLAAYWLEKQGYSLLARNWRVPTLGEADFVAQEGGDVVVVEVKTRRGQAALDRALSALSPRKKATLLALAYAAHRQFGTEEVGLRVDVLAVTLQGAKVQFQLVQNAIQEEER